MKSRAAIVIPAHNRRPITLAGLRRLQTNGDMENFRVLVVDDGSTDGTREAVRAEFPTVEVLAGDGTLWWTGAMRVGMAHAFAEGVTGVIWLNDDCFPEPGTLPALVACLETRTADLAAPTCVDESGGVIPTGFRGRQVIAGAAKAPQVVAGLSGYCVAVHRDAWARLGAPDAEKFPHYFGDTAYTMQAHQAGLKVVLLPVRALLVQHHAQPKSPAELRVQTRSWREDFAAVFTHNKSVFRLATQRHYLKLKYGAVVGTGLFVVRSLVWLTRWLAARW